MNKEIITKISAYLRELEDSKISPKHSLIQNLLSLLQYNKDNKKIYYFILGIYNFHILDQIFMNIKFDQYNDILEDISNVCDIDIFVS